MSEEEQVLVAVVETVSASSGDEFNPDSAEGVAEPPAAPANSPHEDTLPEITVSIPIQVAGATSFLDLAEVATDAKDYPLVGSFWPKFLSNEQIDTNPPYQRESVWSVSQERAFIGSLISKVPIPRRSTSPARG